MVLRSLHRSRASQLAHTLDQNEAVLEYRIAPVD